MLTEIACQSLQTVVDAHAILSATDINGDIVYVNQRFIDISGYCEDELLGRNHKIVRSTMHDREFYRHLWQTVTSGQVWSGDICNRHKSGSLYWVRATIMPVFDVAQSITHYVSIRTDITELMQTKQVLKQLASFDGLTHLANRHQFNQHLYEALSVSKQQQTPLAVLFFDLDGFKNVNDSLGHSVGDKLLVMISERIAACLPKTSIFARWGGDEFVILLPSVCDKQAIQQVVNQVLNETKRAFVIHEQMLFVTLSIGVACYPNNAQDAESLLSAADAAMYYAKSHGRNQLCFYTDITNDGNKVKQLSLQNKLMDALKKEQIQIYFQPIVSCQTHQAVCVEVLARWYDADCGWIAPDVFIALAENMGMINLLGEQVLTKAFTVLAQWKKIELNIKASINLSSLQLFSPNFVSQLTQHLAANDLSADMITLEVTESIAMREVAHAMEKLHTLKELGFSIAIDDFGTGYSSLAQLQDIHADKLKIDRAFIQNIESESGFNLVKAITNMAQSLGLKTVAEGVETAAQQQLMMTLGVDAIQGYLYAKPMPAEDCVAWIKAFNRGHRTK